MDTFLILDPDEHTLARSRCVVLPVPYEETTSYRKGTRHGPEAIIHASAEMEDYDVELGCEPCSGRYPHRARARSPARGQDLTGGPEAMAGRVREAVASYAAQGKLVGMLGGEHSITSGAVAAHAERHPRPERALSSTRRPTCGTTTRDGRTATPARRVGRSTTRRASRSSACAA